jgi:hypothetical protein
MLNMSCWPPISPPHIFTFLIRGESMYSIYRVLRNNSYVHSVAVTWSCGTLVPTALWSSSSATSSSFLILPWERVQYFDSVARELYPLWSIHKEGTISPPSQANKNYTSTRFAYFCLSIGVLKAYYHNRHCLDIGNQFLRLGSRRARQKVVWAGSLFYVDYTSNQQERRRLSVWSR